MKPCSPTAFATEVWHRATKALVWHSSMYRCKSALWILATKRIIIVHKKAWGFASTAPRSVHSVSCISCLWRQLSRGSSRVCVCVLRVQLGKFVALTRFFQSPPALMGDTRSCVRRTDPHKYIFLSGSPGKLGNLGRAASYCDPPYLHSICWL